MLRLPEVSLFQIIASGQDFHHVAILAHTAMPSPPGATCCLHEAPERGEGLSSLGVSLS